VFTESDIVSLLKKGGFAFSVMDWCSDKFKGGCEVYFMSQEYADAHEWEKPKTSEELADGISDAFRSFQMGVKNKVQIQLEGYTMTRTMRMGTFSFQMTPINYRPKGDNAKAIVAALVFITKVGENADKKDADAAAQRGALCFTYSNEIISLCTVDGVILHQNDQSKLFYDNVELDDDYEKTEDEKMDIVRTILPPESMPEFQKKVIVDKGSFNIELQVKPDVWHHVKIFSCFDPVSGDWALTVTQSDISEMNKRKEMLFANMSHELKTPLNGIIALAEVLNEELDLDEDQRGHMTTILNSGRRLNNLVTNLLDASLLRKKALSVRMTDDTSLHAIAEDVLAVCRSINKNTDVKLVNGVLNNEPTFKCDAARLAQIINNLVNNAIKFTFVGSITVSSKIVENKDKSRTISIRVRDTGIGIAEENQKKIFESLRQVDEDADRKFGGTGLGLAISRDLAIAMGGDLGLSSKKGVGSTFSCNLPYYLTSEEVKLQKLHDDRSADKTSQGDRSSVKSFDETGSFRGSDHNSGRASSLRGGEGREKNKSKRVSMTTHRTSSDSGSAVTATNDMFMKSCSDVTGEIEIMSVDDEPTNQVVVAAMVKTRQWKIVKAMDGLEALKILAERKELGSYMPDVILLDVMMPNLNGFETCQRIRKEFPLCAVPIIMVSAKSQSENVIQGLNSGSNDYVTKPFSKVELLARIDTQLQLRHAWKAELEREKSDVLLSSMLPEHIVNKLKDPRRKTLTAKDNVIADSHDFVCMLFSDVVGFTSMSSSTPTIEIIQMLNSMFSAFDYLTEQHGTYKVETIGDAYMCCCGHTLDEEETNDRPGVVARMLRMAMDMLREVNDMHEELGISETLSIRIGIHVGPAHSGVVGVKMPRYCFFGDTVNTASRMESSGFKMCVQVSQSVVDALQGSQLEHEFEFEQYGERDIKGKGEMCTYLLRTGDFEAALEAKANAGAEMNSAEKQQALMKETYARVAIRGARSGSFMLPVHNEADLMGEMNETAITRERNREHLELAAKYDKLRTDFEVKEIELKQLKKQVASQVASSREGLENSSTTVVDGFKSPQPGGVQSPFLSRFQEGGYEPSSIPMDWTDEDVSYWLVSKMPFVGPRYVWNFRENGVDGKMLFELKAADLEDVLGVSNQMHRTRITREIQVLRDM
jgi:DNA-binding response OmpR family regulator/nitrogen-specific signal transduction histidine kinase